jgi:hypothetical protein
MDINRETGRGMNWDMDRDADRYRDTDSFNVEQLQQQRYANRRKCTQNQFHSLFMKQAPGRNRSSE